MSKATTDPLEANRSARTRAYTWDVVYRDINRHYERLKSLRAVARIYGVNHAVIQRALKNIEPENAHIRAALNLSALVPAPACPQCGAVHVSKRCPNTAGRKRPRRVAIHCEDMKSAAATILNNLSKEKLTELIIALLDAVIV